MNHYSLFDSFFQPPMIVVVSEERLQAAEKEAKQGQLKALKARIEELNEYQTKLESEIKALTPAEDA